MRHRLEGWLLWPLAALLSRVAVTLPATPLNDALVQSGRYYDTALPFLLTVAVVKGAGSAAGPLLAAAVLGRLRVRRGLTALLAAVLAGSFSALVTTGWGTALTVPFAEYSALAVSFIILFPVPGRESRRASVLPLAVPLGILVALVGTIALQQAWEAVTDTRLEGEWSILPWLVAWVILVVLSRTTARLQPEVEP